MVIVFQQKNYFTNKKQKKKACIIGEAKAIFFAITVNWYKYQLTVTSC